METKDDMLSIELTQRLVDELQRDRRALQLLFRLVNFLLLLSILFIPNGLGELRKAIFITVSLLGINLIWVLNLLYIRNRVSASISVIARSFYELQRDFFRYIIELREAERFSPLRALDVWEPLLWVFVTIIAASATFYF
jgi:hypothetical protein